jgi:hypothetical protein
LQLGRYYVGGVNSTPDYNGPVYEYFSSSLRPLGEGFAGVITTMHPNSNLRYSATRNIADVNSFDFRGATSKQMGIQQGANMLLRNNDTTYAPFPGLEKSRTPVIVLMTDGIPTLGTDHWMDPLRGPVYGSSNTIGGTGQGVLGYYTILSANYFKRMVSNHYHAHTMFYTIGIGITSRDSGDKYQCELTDGVGDEYARALLNPTQEYIDDLIGRPPNRNNNPFVRFYGRQLHALLYNQPLSGVVNLRSSENYIQIGQNAFIDITGATNSFIPVIRNPYYGSFSYATGSYISSELTQEKLDEMIS